MNTNINYPKILRIFIVGFMFMCVTTIIGIGTREAHQFFFMLGIMILFGLLLRNIWLTLFLWWTVSLYTIFKFQIGYVYLVNVFFGCILYYLTKISFKKEYIDFFINGILWVLAINLMYSVFQASGLDFVYEGSEQLIGIGANYCPEMQKAISGFMGNTSVEATLIIFSLPLLLTRKGILSKIASTMLLVPLYYLHCSMALIASIVITMFVLWWSIDKKLWAAIAILIVLMGTFYIFKVDKPGVERLETWKTASYDAKHHPLKGWGLDSFRNFTEEKFFVYAMNGKRVNGAIHLDKWDNPHNLLISLFYEFGILSIIFLGGYIRHLVLWFKNAFKQPNTIALAGLIIGFFIMSMGHFPAFLARLAVIWIPSFAILEIQTREEI